MITLSEDQVGRLLEGRAVTVWVGEPWDFESADGPGKLEGRIERIFLAQDGENLRSQRVFLDVTPFVAEDGSTVAKLVAMRRYKDMSGIVEQIASGEHAPANFSYEDQVDKRSMPEGVSPSLIGSLKLSG